MTTTGVILTTIALFLLLLGKGEGTETETETVASIATDTLKNTLTYRFTNEDTSTNAHTDEQLTYSTVTIDANGSNHYHSRQNHRQLHMNHSNVDSKYRAKAPIPVPNYFGSIDATRLNLELIHYVRNGYWSQRVVLELWYHQILGEIVTEDRVMFEQDVSALRTHNDRIMLQKEHQQKDGISSNKSTSSHNQILVKKRTHYLEDWGNAGNHVCNWEAIICSQEQYANKLEDWGFRSDERKVVDVDEDKTTNEEEATNGNCDANINNDNVDDEVDDDYYYYNILLSERLDCYCVNRTTDFSVFWTSLDEEKVDENELCQCEKGYDLHTEVPGGSISHIVMEGHYLVGGALPKEIGTLPFLKSLVIKNSNFVGPLPADFGLLQNINEIHLDGMQVIGGMVPKEWSRLSTTLESLTLRNCQLNGRIPNTIMSLTNLVKLDLSGNRFTGSIPASIANLKHLVSLDLGGNLLTGTIPSTLSTLTKLEYLHLHENYLHGDGFADTLAGMDSLKFLNLEDNQFSGPFLQHLPRFDKLVSLRLGMNTLSGALPEDGWDKLKFVSLQGNALSGSISNLKIPSLIELNISNNKLEGTLADFGTDVLRKLDISENLLSGDLSHVQINPKTKINIAGNRLVIDCLSEYILCHQKSVIQKPFLRYFNNRFTGQIQQSFCHDLTLNKVVPFACTDLVACPAGTFHPDGFANNQSGCIKCHGCDVNPTASCGYIGQKDCVDESTKFIRGDMDGDGLLSQREFLRLFYYLTDGNSWGNTYADWTNMNIHECSLSGVNCKGENVTKIDLRGATLCTNHKKCEAIPLEIKEVEHSLEVLDLSSTFSELVHIDIPSSIGMLSKLKILDLSNNNVGYIPEAIGNLSSLRILNLSNCDYEGILIPALWKLDRLERLNLNDNTFSQPIPPGIGRLTNLQELTLSNSHLHGTIPSEIGLLTKLKNLEFYSNALTGTIPSSFENLTYLRRLDLYKNHIEGTIDFLTKMPDFEVIHLRSNYFSGRIPREIGNLQKLKWLDISENLLTGELPASLASIPVLKDLHVSDNKLQPPIPSSLCKLALINGGSKNGSCDHIACPMGTTSETGYASEASKFDCEPCAKEEITIHVGMSSCIKIGQHEYYSMLEALFYGRKWTPNDSTIAKSECDLEMVHCDYNGQVESLVLPLAGIEFNEQLFQR